VADIAAAMRTYLLTQTDVTNEVSTRVYFDVLPQGATLPAVVIDQTGLELTRKLDGTQSLQRRAFQLFAYASTHSDLANTVTPLITAIEMDTGTWDTTTVRRSYVMDSTFWTDAPQDGSQAYRRGCTLTVVMWHE